MYKGLLVLFKIRLLLTNLIFSYVKWGTFIFTRVATTTIHRTQYLSYNSANALDERVVPPVLVAYTDAHFERC